MGIRGRKSAAELTVISSHGIEAVRRPEAPAELTDEQAEEWRRIVNSLPADWFLPAFYPLLAEYCRGAVTLRRIGEIIEAYEKSDEFDPDRYAKMLKEQNAKSNAMIQIARQCRFTPRSIKDERAVKKPKPFKKPWDED